MAALSGVVILFAVILGLLTIQSSDSVGLARSLKRNDFEIDDDLQKGKDLARNIPRDHQFRHHNFHDDDVRIGYLHHYGAGTTLNANVPLLVLLFFALLKYGLQ